MLISNAVMSLIFGAISAYVARSRGKNPFLWFGIGALFGLFGFLFLLFAPQMRGQKPGAKKTSQDKNTIDISPPFDPKYNEKFWYYVNGENKSQGPMSFDAVYRLFQTGSISHQTYVWNETLETWKPLSEFIS